MVNSRAVATQGLGYSATLVATHGLLAQVLSTGVPVTATAVQHALSASTTVHATTAQTLAVHGYQAKADVHQITATIIDELP